MIKTEEIADPSKIPNCPRCNKTDALRLAVRCQRKDGSVYTLAVCQRCEKAGLGGEVRYTRPKVDMYDDRPPRLPCFLAIEADLIRTKIKETAE